jgi:hypothetical protein
MDQEPEFLETERIPRDRAAANGVDRLPPGVTRRRTALAVAVAVDLLQWVAFPLFLPGALSPATDVLDLVVAIAMVRLVGWHWVFLPTFVVELIPFVDLVPTWTLAVLLATRRRR